MPQLSILSQAPAQTMTSVELVDFINASDCTQNLAHNNFMAKVPKVLGAIPAASFESSGIYTNGTGARLSRKIYAFPKREACLMAMSYSYELQAKVFDHMTALEAQQVAMASFNLPKTYPEAMRLAADLADQIEHQQAQLAITAPKAQALDRIADADGSMCITDAAKHLQMQPKRLFSWLAANDWIYRRPGNANWIAYQPRLKAGVLNHKVTTLARGDGTEKVVEQVLVTAKGLARLAEVAA